MLQYLLTGLAGIALGIVAMRVWQVRESRVQVASDPALGLPRETRDDPGKRGRATSLPVLVGAGALAVVAIAILALRPSEEAVPGGSLPDARSVAGSGSPPLDDVDTMIQRLAQRLEKNPADGEGFRMLGWSYVMTGHPDEAVAPYKRAVALLPGQANVHAGYGEALVGVANGTVTQEAKAEFDRAIKIDGNEPRARYFEAMWLAQHGQEKRALEQWIALASSGPADAPWQADLRRRIGDTAAKLGIDVSSRLPKAAPAAPLAAAGAPPAIDSGTVQAASVLPGADRQAMIDQMVEGLARKLAANPRDADGWVRLLRSRMVLKQEDQAGRDLATARRALAGSAADLAKVNAAARDFSVPGN